MNLTHITSACHKRGSRHERREANNHESSDMKRIVILSIVLMAGTVSTHAEVVPQPVPNRSARLSMADRGGGAFDPTADVQKRMDLYKALGVGTLRCALLWADQEKQPGAWTPPTHLRWFQLAQQNGFRLKIGLECIASPPGWLFDQHPDARILNRHGWTSRNYISPWYPGLEEVLQKAVDGLTASMASSGILPSVDSIIVDLGPACEPIYPANWTLGKSGDDPQTSFWYYDGHAQADFSAKMQAAYGGNLARANQRWSTHFAAWADVKIPEPTIKPGAMWNDVLLWYRDTKRRLIESQVRRFQRSLSRYPAAKNVKLVILVPGSHCSSEEWKQAVRTGGGGTNLILMCDTEFLLELAGRTGCQLQYTGMENEPEVHYIQNCLRARHLQIPLWGENAGSRETGRKPDHLADVVIRNRLYGFEYVAADFFLNKDGVTPDDNYPAVQKAYRRMQEYLRSPQPGS